MKVFKLLIPSSAILSLGMGGPSYAVPADLSDNSPKYEVEGCVHLDIQVATYTIVVRSSSSPDTGVYRDGGNRFPVEIARFSTGETVPFVYSGQFSADRPLDVIVVNGDNPAWNSGWVNLPDCDAPPPTTTTTPVPTDPEITETSLTWGPDDTLPPAGGGSRPASVAAALFLLAGATVVWLIGQKKVTQGHDCEVQ